MDSFTGTMVSHHIKIPSRYRTVPWPFTQNLIVSHDQNHDLKFRHAIRPEPWSLSHRTISNSVTLHEPNHDPNSVTLHDPRRARHGAVSGWGSIGVGASAAWVPQQQGCVNGKGAVSGYKSLLWSATKRLLLAPFARYGPYKVLSYHLTASYKWLHAVTFRRPSLVQSFRRPDATELKNHTSILNLSFFRNCQK